MAANGHAWTETRDPPSPCGEEGETSLLLRTGEGRGGGKGREEGRGSLRAPRNIITPGLRGSWRMLPSEPRSGEGGAAGKREGRREGEEKQRQSEGEAGGDSKTSSQA
jgi:hypothetical protein